MNKIFRFSIRFLLILLAIFLVIVISNPRNKMKAEDPVRTITINTAEQLVEYSRQYSGGGNNSKDKLVISITSGDEIVTEGFISLGTNERPFAGEIVLPSTGVNTFRLFNCPLFDYVSTDFKISGSGVINIERYAITTSTGDQLKEGSLFANHVIKGTNAADWKIVLNSKTKQSDEAIDFASVIGEIATESNVSIDFTNKSNLNVSGTGHQGLICGDLGNFATLKIKTSGNDSAISVTSIDNRAGSLVGNMGNSSKLILASNNNSRVETVTAPDEKSCGGLVGQADNPIIEFDGITDYLIKGTLNGGYVGGIFGTYKVVDDTEFSMLNTFEISSDLTLNGTQSTGSLFGKLNNNASFIIDGNNENITSKHTSLINGGLIGEYNPSSLEKYFEIKNTKINIETSDVNNSGGLIGSVTNPGYINIHDVEITSIKSIKAGLISNFEENEGSFIDISGNVKVATNEVAHAGLIYNIPVGVIRLNGTTDLSGVKYAAYDTSAQLIYKNSNEITSTLVYAKPNWNLIRKTNIYLDDLGSWGEVVRLNETTLKETDLFTINDTLHTVTIKAPDTNINSLTTFVKLALNIQLNTKGNVGALQFEGTEQASNLLQKTYNLTSDIDLTGTGIIGLMRDSKDDTTYFSGTFNGHNNQIKLAIGEVYGYDSSSNTLAGSTKLGNIVTHKYIGLFAAANGATVKDLKLTGFTNIITGTEIYYGSLFGYCKGTSDIDNVTSDVNINVYEHKDISSCAIGGLIGQVKNDSLVLSIKNSNVSTNINPISHNQTNNYVAYGGLVGSLSDNYKGTITIENNNISLNIDYVSNGHKRENVFGGLFGKTNDTGYVKNTRIVNLKNNSLNFDVKGIIKNNIFGGIISSYYYSCDTTVETLTVSGNINASGDTSTFDCGGLFQTLTGYLNVKSISLNNFSYNLPNCNSFGFIAGKTYSANSSAALYVDVNEDNYNIDSLTFGTASFTNYDELVVSSRFNGNDITNNSNSVISITTTNNNLKTDGGYLNKTQYGKNNKKINENTRYYYNLEYARNNLSTSKYKFLIWSVKQYAHSSIRSWFNSDNNSFSGDLDMTGLSYYPIDLNTSVSFNDATLKLDANLMNSKVKKACDNDTDSRKITVYNNQHYMMHTAIFRNISPSQTITIDTASLEGNVINLNGNTEFVGFLVAGNVNGAMLNLNDLTFNGLVILNNDFSNLSNSSYNPLLINKISSSSGLKINGAYQSNTAYNSLVNGNHFAASSLIGDVGSATSTAIYLSFSKMVFDSRTSNVDNLTTYYGTNRSIFSKSTFLNSFSYFKDSNGRYDFTINEDWTSPLHQVTYGKEISASREDGKVDKHYLGSVYFVNPILDADTIGGSYFSSNYLPYVYAGYNQEENKHEIFVNISIDETIEGCGQYKDPYIIDTADKLVAIANILNNNEGQGVKIYLPTTLTSYTLDSITKKKYTFGDQNFTTDGNGTVPNATARNYLSGAYYQITAQIELPYDYVSLGTTSSNHNYPFRGVIVGAGNGVQTIIINHSPNPLIKNAYGCVLKDLILKVDVDNGEGNSDITLTAPSGKDLFKLYQKDANDHIIESYGGLISQIFGGDNFIDNVDVQFENYNFEFTGIDSSHFEKLVPIGGYVGTIINGGLIFRNMSSSFTGLTSYNNVNNDMYLYTNPIIGRVLSGYSFYEGTTYHGTNEEATVKNGVKNYTICDLVVPNNDDDKLKVDSNLNINISNGTSLFILSCIVNSGAGSATKSNSQENSYSNISTDLTNINAYYQAYRNIATTRAGATYSNLGDTNSSSDFTIAKNDGTTNAWNKIPYIIRAYTKPYTDKNIYYARCIGITNQTIKVNINADLDVPAGFKGIGNIYYDINADPTNTKNILQLRVQQFNGNGHNINLNMRFIEYDYYSVNSYHAYTTNSINNYAGFGLFNTLVMNSASESNSVNNLSLSGNIFYDIINLKENRQSAYNIDPYNKSQYEVDDKASNEGATKVKNQNGDVVNINNYLSVGGLAGQAKGVFAVKNVIFNNLTVEGAKAAGGLIGQVIRVGNNTNRPIIKYDKSDTKYPTQSGYVSAIGGIRAGGLIGWVMVSWPNITGDTSLTEIKIKNVQIKSQNPNQEPDTYSANITTGAGGLVGCFWGGRNSRDNSVTISNMKVVGCSDDSSIEVLNNNDGTLRNNYAGGFIGTAHMLYPLTLTNCQVKSINIRATVAGGFVGILPQHINLTCENIVVDGDNNFSITGTRHAGGLIGLQSCRDKFTTKMNSIIVQNYIIESTYTGSSFDTKIQNSEKADGASAGGIYGYLKGNTRNESSDQNQPFELNNIYVNNCTIKTNYDNNTSDIRIGTGGFAGCIVGDYTSGSDNPQTFSFSNKKDTAYKPRLCGYNLLFENNNIIHLSAGSTNDVASNNCIGEIIGNNYCATSVRFIAVSIKLSDRNYYGKIIGQHGSTDNQFGTSTQTGFTTGGIIFADYYADSTEHSFSSLSSNNVDALFPYVNVNKSFDINGLVITGDGMANNVEALPIKDIINEEHIEKSGPIYEYAASTNRGIFQNYINQLKMFKTELHEQNIIYGKDDFPILILDKAETINSTLNSYIQLLTNTTYDYSKVDSEICDVVIYKISLNETTGEFELDTDQLTASLKWDATRGFYTNYNTFDSGKIQFSLIDLQFKSPILSEIPYHLYIPVYVKKVLSFNFQVGIKSGTTYLENEYIPLFGRPLIENVGTAVTSYFSYTYERSGADWTEAINGGENILRNYAKTLQFSKINTNDILKDFPEGTLFTLVDSNRGGVPYYGRIEDVLVDNKLILGNFKKMVYEDGEFKINGESFKPLNLCDLMTFNVVTNSSGKFIKCTEEDATIKIGNDYYRLFVSGQDNDSLTKYDISVVGDDDCVKEEYYLTIHVPSSENYDKFHHYLIKSPANFSENDNPSRMSNYDAEDSMVHLIMGKIFEHTNIIVSSDSQNHTQLMTESNNTLNIKLSSEIGLNDGLGEDIKGDLMISMNSIEVYQAFLLHLNMKEGSTITQAIVGSPTATGSYQIDTTIDREGSGDINNYESSHIMINQNFIEFLSMNISSLLATGDKYEIVSNVSITYSDLPSIFAQFPGRSTIFPDNGVSITASSNVGFIEDTIAYSKNRITFDEENRVYYSEADPEVAILNLSPFSNKVGDFSDLGINPLNDANGKFFLLASLDTTSVRTLFTDYASMYVRFELRRKSNDIYLDPITVSDYIKYIKIGDIILNASELNNGININKSLLDDNGVFITLPTIEVEVFTGDELENLEHFYTNYKLTMYVELRSESNQVISATKADNYIIYTNAKVLTDFIDR